MEMMHLERDEVHEGIKDERMKRRCTTVRRRERVLVIQIGVVVMMLMPESGLILERTMNNTAITG